MIAEAMGEALVPAPHRDNVLLGGQDYGLESQNVQKQQLDDI
jgi:hypothetical protein